MNECKQYSVKTKPSLFVNGPYCQYMKRPFDIIMSFFLIIFFLPICLITAILIKLTSKGPIFADVPERVGQNGKLFKMYKFRSMIQNAHYILRKDKRYRKLFEQYKKDSFKLKKDPRVTPVGRFIRKFSIDEIPQLINVLRGEMSLVGPRAYYPDELDDQQKKYPHTIKKVAEVLSVKPGITGLWQVSGRSEINFDKRITIDAKYVHTISLMNDIRIILKTPWAMISGKGAV